ncbi:MAG: hypothetical protein Q8R82_21685 [Hyphomonadaceae bacterium]|nr:hypothetical protein [Hyphomonadaceae bacterium]
MQPIKGASELGRQQRHLALVRDAVQARLRQSNPDDLAQTRDAFDDIVSRDVEADFDCNGRIDPLPQRFDP